MYCITEAAITMFRIMSTQKFERKPLCFLTSFLKWFLRWDFYDSQQYPVTCQNVGFSKISNARTLSFGTKPKLENTGKCHQKIQYSMKDTVSDIRYCIPKERCVGERSSRNLERSHVSVGNWPRCYRPSRPILIENKSFINALFRSKIPSRFFRTAVQWNNEEE